MVQTDQDEKFAGTYRKLFDTIERGVEQCSTDRLQTLLEEKKEYLKLGLEAFGEASSQSRSKISSGSNITVNGKTIKLEQNEKDLIYKISDITNLSEVQCAQLWETYKQEHKENMTRFNNSEQALCENIELIMNVVNFYYEDRISLLECIGSLQRITFDKKHPYSAIATDTVNKLRDHNTTTPFVERLFAQYSALVRSSVPNLTYSFPGWAIVWAKQNLKEQKALLEIIFLFSMTITFNATFIFKIIQEFEADCFGVLQSFGYVLDDEGLKLRKSVTNICILLSVNITIPATLTTETKLSANSQDLINQPNVIAKINQVVLHLGDRKEHAPFLLAWSYFITCLDCILYTDDSVPVPVEYQQMGLIIRGTQQVLSSILITRPTVNGTEFEEERGVSIKQGPNMDRIYLGRSLKLNVFDVITDILESDVCNEEDVNNLGYRSVLRNLFKDFLTTTRPHYLPVDSYASLINAYCLVYKNQATLCDSFWQDDFEKDNQYSLLSTARSRFPVFFSDLTQLLSALSGGANEDKLDGKAAEQVFEYLCQVPSITVELGDKIKIIATEENGCAIIHAKQNIRVTQELQAIASIEITEGSQGLLLSSSEAYSLVQFPLAYSGWHLLTAVLAGFMNPSGSGIDIKDDEENIKGNNIETIDSILDLLHNVLLNNPKLVPILVQHIEIVARIPGQSTGTPIIISVICNILSSCGRVQPCPITTMTLSLQCLTLLIPYYPNEIWSYLQVAPILPRPSSSSSISISSRLASSSFISNPAAQIQQIVSRVECITGRYTLLLSFLDMVQGLVYDIQRNWWVKNGSSPNRQYQVEVLYLCLHYLMLDVFPSYAGWRYKKISERYLIGTKVLEIFTEIARGFKEPNDSNNDGLTLNSIRDGIFKNFLYDGGVYHISPLLDTISEGASTANILYKINHPKEAEKIEKLTEMTFVFIKILLQYRLEEINGAQHLPESTLERLLLERSTGSNCSDFLLRIVKHINYRHNIALQIEATNVLYLLCRTISSWKNIPNFVQYLGDTDQVHQIIRAYLDIAKDHFQSEVLLSAIWRLMTAFLETQPSLAVLFLDCGDFILPSPKSAVRLLAGQTSTPVTATPTPAPTESAIRSAIDVLGHYETLLVQKPTVVSNVLRFIATFWQTAFDHYALVERTRSDNALWDALGKILLNPNNDIDVSGNHLQQLDLMNIDSSSPSTSRNDLNVRRLCCLNLSKAFVMRILSYEIHLTAGNERALGNITTNVLDKLPAGVKNLMNKINEPTKLTQIRQAYVKNDFDPSAAQKAVSSAQDLLQSIGISNTDVLLFHIDRIDGGGDDGSVGEPRQYGDSYLWDFKMAETRVHNLFKDITSKHGFSKLDNLIVTPEVQAVLDIKQFSNNFLKSILEVNYNSSIVDSQIILLRSFKTFIEVSSNRVSDLIWANKSSLQGPASLYTFLMGLIKNAGEEEHKDGVSLTSYSVLIKFIRSLTEDWINKNAAVLSGIDATAKKEYASKTFELLSSLCGLLDRENFAIMKSITDFTAIRFHRPLLESVMLCLHTLGPVTRNISTAEAEFQKCLEKLLDVVCQSFHVLVIKAGSYSAVDSQVQEEVTESCIKDVTVVVSLLQDLISPNYCVPVSIWHSIFFSHQTIPSLLNLFYGGVQLVVKEVDSQCSSNGVYSLSITPYAESALYLLLELSNIPKGADELVANNIYDCFRSNALTTRLQKGTLDLFIRFGEGNNIGPAYVEHNPLHSIWCQMLGVINNLNRHLGRVENVFSQTVSFLQIYSPQIGRAFANANGATDSLFGRTPSESLSSPLLEEIKNICMVFFSLSKNFQKHKNSRTNANNLFLSFKDCSLLLLQRYHHFFTHPVQMQAQLYPVDNIERQDAQIMVPAESKSTTSRFMQQILKSTIVISHYIVTSLIILSEANIILKESDEKWPFGNTIVYPDMHISENDISSFGTLIGCINASIAMLTQAHNSKESLNPESLSLVQDCAVLLVSQAALWISKPGMDEDVRIEVGQDVTEIVDCLVKTESALQKLNVTNNSLGTEIKLIRTLQVFLGNRYYQK